MPLAFGIGKSRGSVFDPAIEACNYIQFYWNWTDGKDFDVRAEFIRPTDYRRWWINYLYEMGWR